MPSDHTRLLLALGTGTLDAMGIIQLGALLLLICCTCSTGPHWAGVHGDDGCPQVLPRGSDAVHVSHMATPCLGV